MTGAPDEHRGGLGTRRDIMALGDDCRLSGRGLRFHEGACGEFGGRPGSVGPFVLHPDTERERPLDPAFSELTLARRDVIRRVHARRPPERRRVSGTGRIRAALDAFHAEHRREYEFEADAPVEAVTFWVTASSATHRIDASRSAADAASGRGATVRSVRFVGVPDAVECPVVPRATLRPGAIAHGPLIVEQMDATTVAAPGERLEIDGSGVMVLRVAPD